MNLSTKIRNLKKVTFNMIRQEIEIAAKEEALRSITGNDDISLVSAREDHESLIDDIVLIASTCGLRQLDEEESTLLDEIYFILRTDKKSLSNPSLENDLIGRSAATLTDLIVDCAISNRYISNERLKDFILGMKKWGFCQEKVDRAEEIINDWYMEDSPRETEPINAIQ